MKDPLDQTTPFQERWLLQDADHHLLRGTPEMEQSGISGEGVQFPWTEQLLFPKVGCFVNEIPRIRYAPLGSRRSLYER